MEKRRNATIDFIRIIASILVIAIHTTNGIIAETIGRWAVPFFMVVTGYFYFFGLCGWLFIFQMVFIL